MRRLQGVLLDAHDIKFLHKTANAADAVKDAVVSKVSSIRRIEVGVVGVQVRSLCRLLVAVMLPPAVCYLHHSSLLSGPHINLHCWCMQQLHTPAMPASGQA
jgi:hypothetical protein